VGGGGGETQQPGQRINICLVPGGWDTIAKRDRKSLLLHPFEKLDLPLAQKLNPDGFCGSRELSWMTFPKSFHDRWWTTSPMLYS